ARGDVVRMVSLLFSVEITDINDHSPNFPEKVKRLEIAENLVSQGTRFPLDAARDPDVGVNSLRKYTLSPNDHFELDVKTRGEDKIPFLILKKPLDREQKLEIMLVLTAFDGGKPVRSGTVNITITVIDVNDNAPVFERQVYTVTLDENAPLGTSVLRLHATDLDDGANGQVIYTFDNSLKNKAFDLFEVDAVTGEITIKGLVDFEEQSVYEIDVQASDKGQVTLTGHCSVVINVKDVNDNAPEMDVTSLSGQWVVFMVALVLFWSEGAGQIRYSIFEELKEGTVVGNIVKDFGIDLSALKDRGFRIVSGSTEPLFQVNQNDGILYVNRKIDREDVCERSSVCLINLKTVLENPLEIHYVAVEVLDVNDHSPSFPEKEKRLEMSESALQGTRFQLHAADDPDSGQYSVQQYKLSQNDHFRLEVKDRGDDRKTPILVLQKTLDREALKSHKLMLTALDGGKPPRSGEIRITVDVSDVNDNAPVFTKDVYSVLLNENAPLGTTVIQVNATDLDEGSNGEVIYSFANDVQGKVRKRFDLDPKTGEIIVTGVIDYEENKIYEIDIQASDKGTAALTTEKSVVIKIVDVNDNAPEIEVTSLSKAIPEDSRPGTTLNAAHDRDGGIYSIQQYKLSPNDHFRLEVKDRGEDRKTPTLILQKALDREAKRSHRLLLTAIDGGKPPRSGDMRITVDVLDVNDNTPVFTKEVYSVTLNENAPLGTTVIQINATDLDEGSNGEIIYSFANDVGGRNSVTFYLIITLGSVSALFLISIIVLIVMQCSKPTDYSSKYLQDTNCDGTLCHSIQYRSGDKRYMLVGPRMSIGSTIVPGSNGNTLVLPERRRVSGEVRSLKLTFNS
uniref:Protocadherin 2 alpha a 15 n=1 Tax=Hucho hucho TaxID=62062 RepID=A0A4W5NQS5_9TELE